MSKTVKYLDLEGLKALYGVVDGKIADAITTAKSELKGDAADEYNTLGKLEDKIQAEETRATNAETALGNRLDTLESGENSVGKQIEALETKLVGDAQTLKTFGAVEDQIETINGEGEGSIKKAAADAVAKVVANAPEDFDTLKEVADWIANDTTGAAKMQSDIATLKGDNTVEGSVAKSVKDAVDALDTTVGGTEVATGKHVAVQIVQTDGVITAVNVNESDIASKAAQEANTALLEGIPAEKKVKGYVDDAVAGAKAAANKVAKAENATHVTVTPGTPDANGSITYTIGEDDIASAEALATVKAAQEANTTAITNAIDETAQSISLGGKELKFVAFTAKEIQDAAKPETTTPTEP